MSYLGTITSREADGTLVGEQTVRGDTIEAVQKAALAHFARLKSLQRADVILAITDDVTAHCVARFRVKGSSQ